MKHTIGGQGQDTTAAVKAWLLAHRDLWLADLILVGEPDDPQALWLTNWESDLVWSPWGTFRAAVVKRGTVSSRIGLEADDLEISLTPELQTFTTSLETASPYQRARLGLYDNQPIRCWSCFMPEPGDADTFGAAPLYGGRVGSIELERGQIIFHAHSFLDVLQQQVPLNVIELTNTLAGYQGATPPPGESVVPANLVAQTGSTTQVIIADRTFPTDVLHGGFVVFSSAAGQSLGGFFSSIQSNLNIAGKAHITLYQELPWPPVAGVDKFYVSAQAPMNLGDEEYFGFPYVPVPTQAL